MKVTATFALLASVLLQNAAAMPALEAEKRALAADSLGSLETRGFHSYDDTVPKIDVTAREELDVGIRGFHSYDDAGPKVDVTAREEADVEPRGFHSYDSDATADSVVDD